MFIYGWFRVYLGLFSVALDLFRVGLGLFRLGLWGSFRLCLGLVWCLFGVCLGFM